MLTEYSPLIVWGEIIDRDIKTYEMKGVMRNAARKLIKNHRPYLIRSLLESDMGLLCVDVPPGHEEFRIAAIARDLVRLKFIHSTCDGRIQMDGFPEDVRIDILCGMVKKDGEVLKHIPPERQTEELRLDAVADCWEAIQYIPVESQSDEVRILAICQNEEALKYIPESTRSKALNLIIKAIANTRNELNSIIEARTYDAYEYRRIATDLYRDLNAVN